MKATNSNKMKEKNTALLLNRIRQGNCSRTQLAVETGLTKAAVSVQIEELLREGWIRETSAAENSFGRPARRLALQETARILIGIDITRAGFSVGLMDLGGRVIGHRDLEGALPPDEFSKWISRETARLIEQSGIDPATVYGVGVTVPGPMDRENGTILNPPGFEAWHGVRVRALLEEALALPVWVENIANACALGEMYFGAARDSATFLALLIQDGIGSGIIVNHKVFPGRSELGHTSIAPTDGRPCRCGNIGCLERYATVSALLAGTPYTDWETAAADREIVKREAGYLSIALTNACNLFDPERILLLGDVQRSAAGLIEELERELKRRTIADPPVVLAGQTPRKTLPSACVAFHRIFT